MKVDAKALLWLKAIVYTLWPASAYATQITLANSLMAVPAAAWVMVFILSTVSGLASLLNTLKVSAPDRPTAFVLSHMLGSWLSGFLVFLAAEHAETADLVETISIALGSYAGAKLVERASEQFMKKSVGDKPNG